MEGLYNYLSRSVICIAHPFPFPVLFTTEPRQRFAGRKGDVPFPCFTPELHSPLYDPTTPFVSKCDSRNHFTPLFVYGASPRQAEHCGKGGDPDEPHFGTPVT